MTNRRCGVCQTWHEPMCLATDRRWPVADLIRAVGSAGALAEHLGWSKRGWPVDLSDLQADRYAIRCGLHPEMVWPGWCEAALTESDRRFVFEGGWRQAWVWGESQACDLPAGNPVGGHGDPEPPGGREAGTEAAMRGREDAA